ncbi:MAG: DUF4832 domain-containing protein [Oscillospiraceae bacterium]|nr:DUF4832 domain-containing protein [Oscillospiraceae bacterium]
MNEVQTVTITPQEYMGAIRNPMMGFMERGRALYNDDIPLDYNPWSTLIHSYIAWNDIENSEDDGIDKIKDFCDALWRDKDGVGVEELNMKVVPRIFLDYPGKGMCWPDDMEKLDYDSEQFNSRLERLVERLGQLWNDDPRVAFVQIGIIGRWGEHHSPYPTKAHQVLLGDLFTKHFPDKMLSIRYANTFKDYDFGGYWDSFGCSPEGNEYNDFFIGRGVWKRQIMNGEISYNFGTRAFMGMTATDGMSAPYRYYMINEVRRLHTASLMWVADYGKYDDEWKPGNVWDENELQAGAEEVQRNMGYRFTMLNFTYPQKLTRGKDFTVSFEVRNDGSAPFYCDWPVELSLRDPKTGEIVWRGNFDVDIREWLPGDGYIGEWAASSYPSEWGDGILDYKTPPEVYAASSTFKLPKDIPAGKYIVSLAVLDPSGNLPSLRFSMMNYQNGGYHPMGYAGVEQDIETYEIDPSLFDNMTDDRTLHYLLT